MNGKTIGCILMILGTSIGAGMLALPVAAAQNNYILTAVLMVMSWAAMTLGAFSLLEVNLWMEPGANIITMSEKTLGRYGKVFAWVVYLLLLYSLLCAYLSGSGDILQALLTIIGIKVPRWLATILALTVLGTVVYRGVSSIDIVNRGFMGIKLIAYCILVFAIAPHIHFSRFAAGTWNLRGGSLMVMITSFGYAIIVPSLRSYLKSNVKQLKRVVLIGSVLPLFIYLLWIGSVQGLIPRQGVGGLFQVLHSTHTNSLLMDGIAVLVNNRWITPIAKLFISICAVTSFLGVSLCLTDFVADGFKCRKVGVGALLVYAISYLPPLLIVLVAPGIFVKALSYAGIYCVLLLMLLPVVMLYSGRYFKSLSGVRIVKGGKAMIGLGVVFSIVALFIG